jgi:hypothetical protein
VPYLLLRSFWLYCYGPPPRGTDEPSLLRVARLHKLFIVDAPKVFSVFWAMLSAFLEADTKAKINFLSGNARRSHPFSSGARF